MCVCVCVFCVVCVCVCVQQVAQEKETTESKWKQERQRRIRTEKRLRLAEDSLKRLDRALKESGVQIDIQIETDVKHLKSKLYMYIYYGYIQQLSEKYIHVCTLPWPLIGPCALSLTHTYNHVHCIHLLGMVLWHEIMTLCC